MDLDDRIVAAKELIAKREEIDRQLADLFGGAPSTPKLSRVCSKCGQSGHTARSCMASDRNAEAENSA
jgi:hypothetical protein